MGAVEIKKFLYDYLHGTSPLELDMDSAEFLDFRYLDEHLDSFEIIQFIMALEHEFTIHLSPEDTESEQIRTIKGLVEIITNKIHSKKDSFHH